MLRWRAKQQEPSAFCQRSSQEGRVELFDGATWGSICDEGVYYGYAKLYDADASVLCREMGFSYGLMLNAYALEFPWTYDQDAPPFVLGMRSTDYYQQGEDTPLRDILRSAWRRGVYSSCGPTDVVSIFCTSDPLELSAHQANLRAESDAASLPPPPPPPSPPPPSFTPGPCEVPFDGYCTHTGSVLNTTVDCDGDGLTDVICLNTARYPGYPINTFWVLRSSDGCAYRSPPEWSGTYGGVVDPALCPAALGAGDPLNRLEFNLGRNLPQGGIEGQVRLVGAGASSSAGALQLYHAGTWALIKWESRGRDPYSRFIAAAACRQLGFESGVLKLQAGSVYGSVASPVWALELGCDYYHSRLTDCDVFSNKGAVALDASLAVDFVGVECYAAPPPPAHGGVAMETEGALRLAGRAEDVRTGRGTIQLYHAVEWSTIIDWGWNRDAAHGVCVALGYTSGNAVMNSGPTYGILPGPILPEFSRYPLACNSWRQNFSACLDEYLSVLPALPFDLYPDGGYSNVAGVACYNDTPGREGDIRLRSVSVSASAGTIEVFHEGTWGTIHQDDWDWRGAAVACRQLGFVTGRPVYNSAYFASSLGA
ncbi:hypothetical protein HXX76_008881 [Chlamydomonas incerta]|uniref:SRCR domain-containing protein n=1 Tax=Chlamydomonas incerta TaxID=51695 RepID=A0A835W1E1_CHLIN|nr:hypothetical protein HXX76_008881 [Chlamydomonas incerta]|eukprot:KAG2432536.1 hypothetical protein HXX76_008881 [Chlamydomonas incerta]